MISVITPTISRPTLLASVHSVIPQLKDGDEFFILGDGPQPVARMIVEGALKDYPKSKAKLVHFVETKGGKGNWGHYQRNVGMRLAARGNYFVFLDDDDVLVPDAFEKIKLRINQFPNCPLMFQMLYARTGTWVPAPGVDYILMGNVSGSCFVCKNDHRKLGKWPLDEYAGDYYFIEKTVEKNGFNLKWVRDHIVTIRPQDPVYKPSTKPDNFPIPPLNLQIDMLKGLI